MSHFLLSTQQSRKLLCYNHINGNADIKAASAGVKILALCVHNNVSCSGNTV